jgi:spermidine synthase
VTALAKKYFSLDTTNPRLAIYHEDGRIFLNRNKKKYDIIFGDAYSSWYSIPYHLTTLEAAQKHYDSLSESGVAIINLISAIE